MLTKADSEEIESILDRASLHKFLDGLAQICFEKAMHVDETWQDRTLSKMWDRAGSSIEKLAFSKNILEIP